MYNLIRLLFLQLKLFKNTIVFAQKFEKIRSVLLLLFVTGLFICSYIISYQVIIYISTFPVIGNIFIIRILALAFLTSFVMLIFSSLIVSFSTLYDENELHLLFSLPINVNSIFFFRVILTSFYSCWMILLVVIPFVVGFASVKNFSILGYFVLTTSVLFKVFIGTVIGCLVTIILSYLFPSRKIKNIVLILIVVLSSLFYSLLRISQPEKFLSPQNFPELVEYLDFLSRPVAKWLPSWWVTEVFRGLMITDYWIVGVNILKLFFVFCFTVIVLYILGVKLFYKSLTRSNTNLRKSCLKEKDLNISSLFRTILTKEIRLFLREPIQMIQFVVVIALTTIYIFNISRLPLEFKYIRVTVSFFNLGGIMFIITALVLRFVFVQPSMEYKIFWLLKSAPVNITHFFIIKFLVYIPMILIPGLIIVTLSNLVLKVDSILMASSLVIILVSSAVLTLAGYSFGILFPKKEYKDIAQIETSFGGLIFILTSLCYIVILLSSIAEPVKRYLLGLKLSFFEIIFYIILFVMINFIYGFTPGYYAAKKFIKEY
ncbi:MAG: hypothetical protein N2555_04125 [Endomicrobia bacterium]|nr:hypothetical protein [Endomicrobiia bacterium]